MFGAPIRRDILQRVVVWQRDNMRQGTQSTKGRADVRGTGKKGAQQKGRGKARVGSMRAPHFRGGKGDPSKMEGNAFFELKQTQIRLQVVLHSDLSQETTPLICQTRFN